MTTNECHRRLQKELKKLNKDPLPGITARPSPNNLLDWHYVISFDPEVSSDSPFSGGVYWGRLSFPPDYPFKPPAVMITTPNGRFAVNTKLCTSFSDFHPESWHPGWSVGTILVGFQSFMNDVGSSTTGAISTSREQKRKFASDSLDYNIRIPLFTKIFPEWLERKAEWEQKVQQSIMKRRKPSDPHTVVAAPSASDASQSKENPKDKIETRYQGDPRQARFPYQPLCMAAGAIAAATLAFFVLHSKLLVV